jgi:hypothetical protein
MLGTAAACGPQVSSSDSASADGSGSGSSEASGSAEDPSGVSSSSTGADESATDDGSGGSERPDLDAVRPCDGTTASWVATDGVCEGNVPCFTTIQDAVDAATEMTTIWVGPGSYVPSPDAVHVVESVAVLLCLRSLDGPLATVLDGQGIGTVVRAGYEGPLWIEGFTVRGGGPSGSDVLDGFGIGIGGWQELHGWIVGNIVEDNVMGRGGVAFLTSTVDFHADILVSGNLVRNNRADTSYGGAIQIDLTGPGADTGRVRIENNVSVDNDAGGLGFFQYLSLGSALESAVDIEVVHNTMSGNTIGMTLPTERLTLHNNIVYGNEADLSRLEDPTSPSVLNNLLGNAPAFVGIDGNSDADPLFVNAPGGDYHVEPSSPARDAGSPVIPTEFDLEGRPRDAQPDIGAYELP